MKKELFALFVCPSCHSSLVENKMFLFCMLCKKRYSFRGGIVNFCKE